MIVRQPILRNAEVDGPQHNHGQHQRHGRQTCEPLPHQPYRRVVTVTSPRPKRTLMYPFMHVR